MRYSCQVCGMNHSRPCDAGLACGILQGIPVPEADRRSPFVIRLIEAVARFVPLGPRKAQGPRS